jgi:hypothetical protein
MRTSLAPPLTAAMATPRLWRWTTTLHTTSLPGSPLQGRTRPRTWLPYRLPGARPCPRAGVAVAGGGRPPRQTLTGPRWAGQRGGEGGWGGARNRQDGQMWASNGQGVGKALASPASVFCCLCRQPHPLPGRCAHQSLCVRCRCSRSWAAAAGATWPWPRCAPRAQPPPALLPLAHLPLCVWPAWPTVGQAPSIRPRPAQVELQDRLGPLFEHSRLTGWPAATFVAATAARDVALGVIVGLQQGERAPRWGCVCVGGWCDRWQGRAAAGWARGAEGEGGGEQRY